MTTPKKTIRNTFVEKVFSKSHWDKFIYGLLYPGFVGSMFYELIPTAKGDLTMAYFGWEWRIKFVITLFYILDYFHLYGDMHEIVPQDSRTKWFLICDIFSSLCFFTAFVLVKMHYLQFALIPIAIVPIFFLIYKWDNFFDRLYHIPYVALGISIGLYYCFKYFPAEIVPFGFSLEIFLFIFIVVSLLIYAFYYVFYFEWYCKDENIRLQKLKK
jgi:hypothetical protein